MKKPFNSKYYLTDGGLETTLIFHKGVPLRSFEAFELLNNPAGRSILEAYYQPYLQLAVEQQTGFILESPTWRANTDWGIKLGYTYDELFAINKQSLKFLQEISLPYMPYLPALIVSGNIGPRGDGYHVQNKMAIDEAKAYHTEQVKAFSMGDADIITAATINYSEEGIGIVYAARAFDIPVVISFTVETNGYLPSGESLQSAIEKTDSLTDGYVSHYMINCAHPEHFKNTLKGEGAWKDRICGLRANASTKSHAELDESDTLDPGDKDLLVEGYLESKAQLPALKIIGGCCGTDHSHIHALWCGLKDTPFQ